MNILYIFVYVYIYIYIKPSPRLGLYKIFFDLESFVPESIVLSFCPPTFRVQCRCLGLQGHPGVLGQATRKQRGPLIIKTRMRIHIAI